MRQVFPPVICLTITLFFLAGAVCAPSVHAGSRTSVPAGYTSEATVPGKFAVKVAVGVGDPLHAIRSALAGAGADAGRTGVRPILPLSILRKSSVRGFLEAGLDRVYIVEVPPQPGASHVHQWIAGHSGIEYAEPLYYHRVDDIPNDPQLPLQIGVMKRLQMYPAWDIGKGDRAIAIAIVDGGTFWRHEDLQPILWVNQAEDLNNNGLFDPGPPPAGDEDGVDQDVNGFVDDVIGWNFTTGSCDPDGIAACPESRSHGTATAGVACAATNNAIGMAGTSWNCSLLPVCAASTWGDNLIEYGYEGILYAALRGARIINVSWRRRGAYSRFEQDVIGAATLSGALVVAAAGNDAEDNDVLPSYPGAYAGVLAVGATNTSSDLLAAFSNYGASIPVYAPGVVVVGPTTDGGYLKGFNGTSFSAPLVAGIAGLIASQRPELSPERIAGQLRMTADPIDDENPTLPGRLGRGRVNAFRAMTESHAVIALKRASAEHRDPTARGIFLPGDTIHVSLAFQNISDVWDQGWDLTVRVVPGDPSIEPLLDQQIVEFPAPGVRVDVPPLLFRVGPVSGTLALALRIEWSWAGGEVDRTAIPISLSPTAPAWVSQMSPVPVTFFSVSAPTGQAAWAAGSNPGGGPAVVRTTDGGSTWRNATGDLQGEALYCVFALDQDRAWVGTGSGRIFRTTDGGSTWTNVPYPPPESSFMNGVWFVDPAFGYALGDPPAGASKYVLLRTTDGGQTWDHMPDEPVGDPGEGGLNNSFWWTDAMHGWFGTSVDKVWRTWDGGATWQSSPCGAAASLGVAFSDNQSGLAVHTDGTVSRTTDGGLTWSNAPISPTRLSAVAVVRSSPLAWVSSDAAPFFSADDGASWRAEVTYPIRGSIYHLSFADSTTGWAVTSAGEILRHVNTVVSGAGEEDAGVPKHCVLEQNFPNPFNPATTIRYAIAGTAIQGRRGDEVRLAVYDVLGREVAILASGKAAAGTYEVKFSAGNLASGVYLCRLTAGNFVQTRKMIVVR